MKSISISELVARFDLEILAGENALDRQISSEDIHRPGLEFTGYLEHFPKERLQVLGNQEIFYLHSLPRHEREARVKEYIKQQPPCIIVARGLDQLSYIKKYCEYENVPLLRTTDHTTSFISKVNTYLKKQLAREMGVHGVCVNVFGVGILIRGQSGVGKSEVALTLIERGHRLVSDDIVILKQIGPEALIGTHNGNNQEFLALRGVGLINFPRLYGSGSIQDETKINLDILLSPWNENTYYDAMGAEEKTLQYLDIFVKHIEIPIRPGRDLASLIEVAAKNWRLQEQGYKATDDFQDRIKKRF